MRPAKGGGRGAWRNRQRDAPRGCSNVTAWPRRVVFPFRDSVKSGAFLVAPNLTEVSMRMLPMRVFTGGE